MIASVVPASILRRLPLLVLAASVWGCDASLLPPPDQIIGRWSTDASRYHDRVFEIKPDAVVFGTGRFTGARQHILIGVEQMPAIAGREVYVLHYREFDGAIGKLEIHHASASRDQIQFANRPEIWTRAGSKEQDDA